MITERQKQTAEAIVNIFETGRVRGDYGKVTLLQGDPGRLTYGRSQTTLTSGNLYLLIQAYCNDERAEYAKALKNYLPALKKSDLALDDNASFKNLLRSAGDDPVMHRVQDEFFDRVYWKPAARVAESIQIQCALGFAVVYDGQIHGSLLRSIARTKKKYGVVSDLGERIWIERYVAERKDWLATHKKKILRKTVYRMEEFERLIEAQKWDLSLPLNVRGVDIRDEDFETPSEPVRAWAGDKDERILRLTSPLLKGDDVKQIQSALIQQGFDLVADGRYGKRTADAVRAFQSQNNITVDGIVGPSTRTALTINPKP